MSSSSDLPPEVVQQAIEQALAFLPSPLWGIIVSIGLYGIIISQAWIYTNKNSDEWYLRAIVAVLVVMDFANVILEAELVNHIFLKNYGNPIALLAFPSVVPTQMVITAIIILVVQFFFASRVYFVCDRSVLKAGFVVVTALASIIPAFMVLIDMYRKPSLAELGTTYRKILFGLFAGFADLCDISTTIMLSIRLYVAHTDRKRTSNVVQKLLLYIVTRGLLIGAVHLVNIVLYLAEFQKLHWTITFFCMSRVYLLTMLGMLNSRYELRESMQENAEGGIDLRSMIGSKERARQGVIDVNIQTVQLVVKEDSDMEHSTGTGDQDAPYLKNSANRLQTV